MNDMNILKNIYVLLIERNRRKEVEINAKQIEIKIKIGRENLTWELFIFEILRLLENVKK